MRPNRIALWLLAASLTPAFAQQSNDPAARVNDRVKAWQPVAAERRFDDIGWTTDLLEARRLSKTHQRPVFLFTHDGHMAVGRC